MFEPHASVFSDTVEKAFAGASLSPDAGIIERLLGAVRTHLGLQVAYVSQIVGDEAIFRHVDAPGLESMLAPGDRRRLDDVYSQYILEGRLPQLIPDTAHEQIAVAKAVTGAVPIGTHASLPIGAHVSVPLHLSDGSLYGMFCCLGPVADPSLNERDLGMMRVFADLAAREIDRTRLREQQRAARIAPIEAMIADRNVAMQFQPIWRLGHDQPIGFEALSRFMAVPLRTPDLWFTDAADVGLGIELELMVIDMALGALELLPAPTYLTLNASPATAASKGLQRLLKRHPLDRVVLEITEHQGVDDFGMLADALAEMRAAGLRLAVDDAGVGYSGLQHILQLKPDIIKLDRFFVRQIDSDPSRRALAASLAVFAGQVGSTIIAEGVEVAAELDTLRALGFNTIQGYLLGKPQPLPMALALMTRRTSAPGAG